MIKQKRVRSKKYDSDGSQAPITAPKDTSNPFAKWMVGLAVLSLLVIGGPVALWAQSEVTGETKTNLSESALKDFKENFSLLQKSFENLLGSQKFSQVVTKIASGTIQTCKDDTSKTDCLNKCRKNLATCKPKATETKKSGLDSCLSQTNECVTKCNYAPRPPIACEDRCAVALGGCLEKVSQASPFVNNSEAMEACRVSNRACLVNACKLGSEMKLPENHCKDQCKRLNETCACGSAKNNPSALAECDKLKSACEDNLCAQPFEEKGNCSVQQIKECSNVYLTYMESSGEEAAIKMKDSCLAQCEVQAVKPKDEAPPVKCTIEEQEMCHVEYKACGSKLSQEDQAGEEACLSSLNLCKKTCQPVEPKEEAPSPVTAPSRDTSL